MPMTSSSLLTALERAVPGGIFPEIFERTAMAGDASHYALTPTVVVRPETAAEVGQLFRISHDEKIGMTFRSGGTSLSGQGISSGLLIDTRRKFKEIEVLDEGMRVRVQPGATIKQVNIALAKFGRKLGPDPASEIACTVGGVVANNSSGMACGTEFNTYATLDSLTLVLPSGTVIDTGTSDADEHLRVVEPELYAGLANLRNRILANGNSIEKISKLYAIKNTMGYSLNSFVDYSRPIDILGHLIVGSEGTLAFIAEVTFRTVPLLQKMATGLLIFDTLADATRALPSLKESQAAVIELLDTASLRVAQHEHMADTVLAGVSFQEHAALLVEYQASTQDVLDAQVAFAHGVFAQLPVSNAQLSTSAVIRNELWRARKGLYAAVAGNRPSGTSAILEDIAVPMGALHETTMALSTLFQRHHYEGSVIFGHAKDGNLHFLLNERFDQPELLKRYQDFTEDLVSLVLSHEGSLKAEHGTGRIMAPYVRRQCGDELYEVMIEVKRLCDPKNLLNPGVLINDNELAHIQDIKINPSVDSEVDRCVECGYCEPVCPSRDLTLTPRQRIAIRRATVKAQDEGDFDLVKEFTKRFDYEALQTCAADGMCAVSCPVHIDTGQLVKRLRAEGQSELMQRGGLSAARNWRGISQTIAVALSIAKSSPKALTLGVNKLGRNMISKDLLPLWSVHLPRGGSTRLGKIQQDADVLYFPSCVNSLFAAPKGVVGVEKSFLSLCERAGIKVRVPENIPSLCCGTPWKSKGLIRGYELMSEKTKSALLQGRVKGNEMIPVVCDSSSCTEGLLGQMGGEVNIIDAVAYIAEIVLPKLHIHRKIASLVLHPTCSGVQMGLNAAMIEIGNAVANEVIIPENWACCGFAGDRGMLHPELTASATQSEAREVNGRTFEKYASSNRPCEIGMTSATGHDYVHLLQVLEEATRR